MSTTPRSSAAIVAMAVTPMLTVLSSCGVERDVLTSRAPQLGPDGFIGVTIGAGEMSMGSPPSESCRGDNETLHRVHLTRGYVMSATETTREQFLDLMGYDPSLSTLCTAPRCPVDNVSWHEAAAFCNTLSRRQALGECYACTGDGVTVVCTDPAGEGGDFAYECPGYRLPTEAEWEYAYRAGSQTALYNASLTVCLEADAAADAVAWYDASSGGHTHPVQQLQANAWGLFDLAGNVWEWCQDGYLADLKTADQTDPCEHPAPGETRVSRGGAWDEPPAHARAAFRNESEASYRDGTAGFRCVRSAP